MSGFTHTISVFCSLSFRCPSAIAVSFNCPDCQQQNDYFFETQMVQVGTFSECICQKHNVHMCVSDWAHGETTTCPHTIARVSTLRRTALDLLAVDIFEAISFCRVSNCACNCRKTSRFANKNHQKQVGKFARS